MKSFSGLILLFLKGPIWAWAGPGVDLSGEWQLRRGEAVSTVTMPFDGFAQPEGRYRLERTVTLPAGMPIDDLGVAPGNLLGNYKVSVNGQVVGRVGDLGDWLQPLPEPRVFAVPPEAIPSDRTLRIGIEIHQRLAAGLRLPTMRSIPSLPRLEGRSKLEEQIRSEVERSQLRAMSGPIFAAAGLLLTLLRWLFEKGGADAPAIRRLMVALA